MTPAIESEIRALLARSAGWCDPAKGIALADLVLQHHPRVCVEIGVFAGKSLLSTAIGLREAQDGGVIHGIDSWSTSDCIVDVAPADKDWWSKLDIESIYREFLGHVVESKLSEHVRVLRMSSLEAAKVVPSPIHLLHIDGCHSEWSSTSDVCLWLPRVAPGGIVVMDDVNWESTQTAVRFVQKWCEPVNPLWNTPESVFGVFRKR